jgi:hypothetical protein
LNTLEQFQPEEYMTPTPLIQFPEIRIPTYKEPRDVDQHGKPTHPSKKSEKRKTKTKIEDEIDF